MEEQIRLQKYMADCGVASRRKCEEYILAGRVAVNGRINCELGVKVNPNKDKVEVDGKEIKQEEKKVYILLNKPIDYVTTANDQFQRKTVLDLVKEIPERLVPVGRLDMYTSGALLLSNDGDFVYHVTHPKYEVEKTYIATIIGDITEEELDNLRNGIPIDDYITGKAKVKKIKWDSEKNLARVVVVIHEGKNREVRKMFERIGKKVKALHRSKIGEIAVKDMKIGTWRYLSKKEIDSLLQDNRFTLDK